MRSPVPPIVCTAWRTSTRSGAQGQCVEIGSGAGVRGVRDSKLGVSSPVLRFGEPTFASFLAGVKAGKLDR